MTQLVIDLEYIAQHPWRVVLMAGACGFSWGIGSALAHMTLALIQ